MVNERLEQPAIIELNPFNGCWNKWRELLLSCFDKEEIFVSWASFGMRTHSKERHRHLEETDLSSWLSPSGLICSVESCLASRKQREAHYWCVSLLCQQWLGEVGHSAQSYPLSRGQSQGMVLPMFISEYMQPAFSSPLTQLAGTNCQVLCVQGNYMLCSVLKDFVL